MSNKLHNQSGQSLLELLIAMGVFVLVIASTMFLALDAHLANQQGGQRTRAAALAQEGIEASKSLASRGWKYLTLGTHGLSAATNVWQYNGPADSLGIFSRTVTVAGVNRNVSGDIVTSGGTLDPDTKLVTSRVTWLPRPNRPSEVVVNSYFTNWKSRRWTQTRQSDFDDPLAIKTGVVSTNVSGGELELASAGGGQLGNEFKINNTTPVRAQDLSNSAYRTSLRFTAQSSKTANTIRVYLQTEQGASPTYRYGLQTDNGGNPSGVWLGSGTQASTTTGWQTITLSPAVALTAGSTYHLVVQHQSGTINGSRFIALRVTTPQNALIPPTNHTDAQSNVLTTLNNGGTWTVDNEQPIYVLGYSDATYEGNPYISLTENSAERIFRSNYVGEKFTPDTDVTTSAITFEVKKVGNPVGNLIVALYDVSNSALVEQGVLSPATLVTTSYAPYTFAFTAPRMLSTGTTYRIYLYSLVANSTSNYFRIRRLDVSNSAIYRGLSYFGESAVLTYSANAGSSWTDAPQADIGGYHFTLQSGYQTSGDFISSAFDTGSIDTVENYLTWTSDVPVGTTLQYQLRTAATEAGLSGAIWVGPNGAGATYFTAPGEVIADNANTRWVQYRAYFTSTGAATPTLSDITVNYE